MPTNDVTIPAGYACDYEKMQEIIAYADENEIHIDSLKGKFFNVYPDMLRGAKTEEKIAFVQACAREITACYQRALQRNYREIQDCKARGVVDSWMIEKWTLTLDKDGRPTRTAVVDVDKKGYPLYADGCTEVFIDWEARRVGEYRYKLNRWLEGNRNWYVLRQEAQALQQKGPLGLADPPTPDYDLDGLVGGQRDAAAWQNYAIENGMVPRTDYDVALEKLLAALDKCIAFYEQAISIF